MSLLRNRGRVLAVLAFVFLCITVTLVHRHRQTYGIPDSISKPLSKVFHGTLPSMYSSPKRPSTTAPQPMPLDDAIRLSEAEPHVIDDLLRKADVQYEELLGKEAHNVEEAAKAYRTRRGRYPPPRFDQWVQFAEKHNALIVEDFFDRIYEDLGPFWALKPKTMRDAVLAWPDYISVRGGKVAMQATANEDRVKQWRDMIQQIAHLIPDVDLAMNVMDETRMFVPWESVNHYMAVSSDRRAKVDTEQQQVLQIYDYPKRSKPTPNPDAFDPRINTHSTMWSLVWQACPPAAPIREATVMMNMETSPSFPEELPHGTHHGFVSNLTLSRDPCVQNYTHGIHGNFIEPTSESVTQALFPLFGGTKLSVNGDILLPAPSSWTSQAPPQTPWEDQQDRLMWRSTASGGRSRLRTWARFHRHRFVSMMNGTHVQAAQIRQAHQNAPEKYPPLGNDIHMYTWPLPDPELYPLAALQDRHMGSWVDSFTDVSFFDLECFPREDNPIHCPYTEPFYALKPKPELNEEFQYKYLPDLDANGLPPTAHFLSLLKSNSVPLKASLYSEWHDSRLVPWKHFVPVDVSYREFWGIMEYFLGYDPEAFEDKEMEVGYVRNATKEALKLQESTTKQSEIDTSAGALPEKVNHPEVPSPIKGLFGALFSPEDEEEDISTPEDPPEQEEAIRRSSFWKRAAIPEAASHDAPAHGSVTHVHATVNVTRIPGHDAVARHIAESGRLWAERVLRKEDMLVYVYRLILEYARVVSEERDRMMWKGLGDTGYAIGRPYVDGEEAR